MTTAKAIIRTLRIRTQDVEAESFGGTPSEFGLRFVKEIVITDLSYFSYSIATDVDNTCFHRLFVQTLVLRTFSLVR